MSRTALVFAAVAAVFFAAACHIDFLGDCAGVGIVGIAVDVRDPAGNSALEGTTVVATDGSYADTVGPVVSAYNGSLSGPIGPTANLAENRGGNYEVTATKPYWSTATQRVHVPGGRCGYVETQNLQLTIAKLPSAPPVRSVAVAPRSLRFSFCGSAGAANAFVEVDPGMSNDVTWQSEDTNVVTVSTSGATSLAAMVHVKSRGRARVAARAVANPSVVGYLIAQVDPECK